MVAAAGVGYVDGNAGATSSGFTYVDKSSACDGDGWVTSIVVNLTTNGGSIQIGCGLLDGTTFTPRNYVTIDTSGDGTGVKTYTHAGGDFVAFPILENDYLYFYSDNSECRLDRTTTPSPKGYGFISGDHMADASFTIGSSTASAIEFECTGQADDPFDETMGYGEGDHGGTSLSNDYTYVDKQYPATKDFLCDKIYFYNTDAGSNFRIGHGTISESTFIPKHYVTLTPTVVGANIFNAPADFIAFPVDEGDRIFLYSNMADAEPDTTYAATPEGLGWIVGDQMDETDFDFTSDDSRTIEVQFSGEEIIPSGWDTADIDELDPSNIDTIDGLSLDDLDTIDEL